jgi:hypothetical protein
METSAKDSLNIEDLFVRIAKTIMKKPAKSKWPVPSPVEVHPGLEIGKRIARCC